MSQKHSLLDLGGDIIASEIIPNLSPKDIHALGSTCQYLHSITNEPAVWHQLYTKAFGVEPTPFAMSQYKWPELFKMRKAAKLMTWGKSTGGRLGYSMRNVPKEHVSRRGVQSSVTRPTIVDNIQDTVIADVSAGGFSFQVLTSEGDLYFTGVTWNGGLTSGPGPLEADQISEPDLSQPSATSRIPEMGWLINIPFRLGGVIPRPRNGVPPPPRPGLRPLLPTATAAPTVMPDVVVHPEPPELRHLDDVEPIPKDRPNTADGFVNRLTTGSKIVAVSSGRSHVIALDDSGHVWTWDHPRQRSVGLKLKFVNDSDEPLNDSNTIISKIIAGWNLSCCYMLNVGIVYWTSRDSYSGELAEIPHNPVRAHYKVIPGTGLTSGAQKIIDIVAGESFIVYLTLLGKLYRVDIHGDQDSPSVYELARFNSYLTRHSDSSQDTPPKFVRLSGGTFRTFVAISDEDLVLLGTKDSNSPEVIPELQKKGVISVAVGDYHCLALTKDGQLMSWGLESEHCGCLGLGTSEPFVHSGAGEIVGRNGFRVFKPTKVDIQGKVLAIGAAGWQSCAIVDIENK